MDMLESLISDGKKIIDGYNNAVQERYGRVQGIEYETWMGKGIMTIGLIAYVLAIVWAQRIMDVEI